MSSLLLLSNQSFVCLLVQMCCLRCLDSWAVQNFGLRVGPIIQIRDNSIRPTPVQHDVPHPVMMSRAAAPGAAGGGPPVAIGKLDARASITVEFSLLPAQS